MEKYLLTSMQQGILFDCLKSPSEGYYIQQLVCTFPKGLDADIIREAWKQSVKANKVLRTRFCTDDSGDILQFFDEEKSFQFNILDGDTFDKDTFLSKQRSAKIDILNDNLWSVTLVCSKEKTEMIWCFHHIILDGRSHSLILEDVFRYYNSGSFSK